MAEFGVSESLQKILDEEAAMAQQRDNLKWIPMNVVSGMNRSLENLGGEGNGASSFVSNGGGNNNGDDDDDDDDDIDDTIYEGLNSIQEAVEEQVRRGSLYSERPGDAERPSEGEQLSQNEVEGGGVATPHLEKRKEEEEKGGREKKEDQGGGGGEGEGEGATASEEEAVGSGDTEESENSGPDSEQGTETSENSGSDDKSGLTQHSKGRKMDEPPIDYSRRGNPLPDYGKSERPKSSLKDNVATQLDTQGAGAQRDRNPQQEAVQGSRMDTGHSNHEPVAPVDMSDLSKLTNLTENTITDCLEARFKKDIIYTRCGDILISVNPYKPLGIYTKKEYREYHSGHVSDTPHLFAVSAKAYTNLRENSVNQVILVSGESGAGKTEATKYMVRHLMAIGGSELDNLEEKVIQVNPLLEAFGNARTKLNNNSSRFAKFLRIDFSNASGKIASARIKDYILEKSRVVQHGSQERTFHSFYALLAGASDQLLEQLYLDRSYVYRVTGDFSQRSQNDPDFKKIFTEMQSVFKLIDLADDEEEDVYYILAAVLLIAEVEFKEEDHDTVSIANQEVVAKVAVLLNIDEEKLTAVLIQRQGRLGSALQHTTVYGEVIRYSKNKKQAEEERDSLAKALYERLFGWLVQRVNKALSPSDYHSRSTSIGILDICGFENLVGENGFEQMCINVMNETLQNFMNRHIIEEELQILKYEGVDVGEVDTDKLNNDLILSMFQDKHGLLALIDEDSKFDIASSDDKLVRKMNEKFRKNEKYIPSTHDRPEFAIAHFAGDVTYKADNFLKKNKDALSDMMLDCMMSSKDGLVMHLFRAKEGLTGTISMSQYQFPNESRRPRGSLRPRPSNFSHTHNLSESINQSTRNTLFQKFGDKRPEIKKLDSQKKTTHITFFKNSLNDLLREMQSATAYFVRCIKPNDRLTSDRFLRDRVIEQLRYNGVTQVARIRSHGFGHQIPRTAFKNRYQDLVDSYGLEGEGQICDAILNSVCPDPNMYKVGITKVFLKEPVYYDLRTRLEKVKEEKRKKEEEERLKREEEEKRRKKEELEEKRKRQREQLQVELERERQTPIAVGTSRIGRSVAWFDDLNTIQEAPHSNESSIYNRTDSASQSYSASLTPSEPNSRQDGPPTDKENTAVKDVHTAQGGETKEEDAFTGGWDIFSALDEEEDKPDVHEQPVLMGVKAVIYILFFIIIFAAVVCQKISLLVLVQDVRSINMSGAERRVINKENNQKTVAYILLIIALCIPPGLALLISLAKLCFGSFKSPSIWT
ncbi:myosin IA heavy chain, partial [Aplysia californica]|uniref:Myosin IA heavy chain n=1 Tax=Aplysia californica TaxID=6500 RepID=A0ABM1VPF2_APLCA